MSLSVYSKANAIANSFRSSVPRSPISGRRVRGTQTAEIGNRKSEIVNPLRRACQEFEALFTAYLLKNMRRTVSQEASLGSPSARKSELTHGWRDSFSRDVYLSIMDEEVAAYVARGPGIGLAETLYRQLSISDQYADH